MPVKRRSFTRKHIKNLTVARRKRTDVEEKATNWKGNEVSYSGIHHWLKRRLGKATRCDNCKSKTAKRYEWANISGQYLRKLTDYKQLCPSCHRRLDYGDFCKRRHKFSQESYLNLHNHRICIKCREYYYRKNLKRLTKYKKDWYMKHHNK